MSSLAKILEQYGYKSREQQLDVIRLLYLAGCFDSQTLADDLKEIGFSQQQIDASKAAAKEAGANDEPKKDLEKFKPDLILERLFFTSFETENSTLAKIHKWLIQVTQREFFARDAGQERWQQPTGQWMKTYEKEIHALVERLGLEKEVAPSKKEYAGILVLGATGPEMKKRLEYARVLIERRDIKTQQLFLLCGERPATKNVDGDEAYLKEIASKNNIPLEKVTETHLMQAAYTQVAGSTSKPEQAHNLPQSSQSDPNIVKIEFNDPQHVKDIVSKLQKIEPNSTVPSEAQKIESIIKKMESIKIDPNSNNNNKQERLIVELTKDEGEVLQRIQQLPLKEGKQEVLSIRFSDIPVKVIDTPKGAAPRPNTGDTVRCLAKTNPDLSGDMLFVSRAPNIQAQAEDIWSISEEVLPKVKPEVGGAACENVALNRIMGAVGGALFGGYSRVALALGVKSSKEALEKERKEFSYNAQAERRQQQAQQTHSSETKPVTP